MKKLLKMLLLLPAVMLTFSACDETEEPNGSDGKAKIENLAISPNSNLKYGDVVTLTGSLSDETGLSSYTIQISNASGVIYEDMQMLTGKTFSLNREVVLPLAANAVTGNLKLNLTVKNSGNQMTTEELDISNVTRPDFSKLYLIVNNAPYDMVKDGDIFTFEDFVPAGATGKIYVNANQTGHFWGWEEGKIKSMAAGNIPLSQFTEEKCFTISFNVVNFNMEFGEAQDWRQLTGDDLYVLGTISGNWEDNACCWDDYQNEHGIVVEMEKMKMKAFYRGNQKMWTWEPSEDMWGETSAGIFRLKKAGKEEYVLYSNGQIVTSSNNSMEDDNFIIPVGGQFNIRVMGDETGITSVRAFDDEQEAALEYKNGEVLLNGVPALPSVSFAGNALSLVPGNYFVYQGTINLEKDKPVTGDGIDLKNLYCDADIFTGGGNATWTFTGPTSSYYILIDAFSGHVYMREMTGYPKVIYMDGWCWSKYPGDPRSNWDTGTEMTLYPVGGSVYEGTCYIFPWGGDMKFFARPTPAGVTDVSPGGIISGQHFTLGAGQALMTDDVGLMLPVPAGDGAYYKVSVDLKDGLEIDEDGGIVGPKGAKFTYSFTPL